MTSKIDSNLEETEELCAAALKARRPNKESPKQRETRGESGEALRSSWGKWLRPGLGVEVGTVWEVTPTGAMSVRGMLKSPLLGVDTSPLGVEGGGRGWRSENGWGVPPVDRLPVETLAQAETPAPWDTGVKPATTLAEVGTPSVAMVTGPPLGSDCLPTQCWIQSKYTLQKFCLVMPEKRKSKSSSTFWLKVASRGVCHGQAAHVKK
jgi:hypothetical protein